MSTKLPEIEHEIFMNLCEQLAKIGYRPHTVFDGEEHVDAFSAERAEEIVAGVDDSTVCFKHPNENRTLGVFITAGEGRDIICDYSAPNDDPYGWNTAIDNFIDELNHEV